MYAGRRGVVWKTPDITADGLKIFACVMMLIQSVGISVVEKGLIGLDQYTQESLSRAMEKNSELMMLGGVGSVMQLMGGLAAPIFAFLLVEGFLNTSNYKKYLLTMVIFALVSEIPYDLAMEQKVFDWSGQNALVSMTICLVMLSCLKTAELFTGGMRQFLRLAIVVAASVWVTLFRGESGLGMVLLTAVFYIFYGKNGIKTVLGILISLFYVTGPLSFYGICCYNGKRTDRFPKYLYYIFYPLHLLVLGVIVHYFIT